MLKLKKGISITKVYDTEKKEYVTIKDDIGFVDPYADGVFENVGDEIVAKNGIEELRILEVNGIQKAIALIKFKEKIKGYKYLKLNELLENPNTAVYLFNTSGESIVNFVGYFNKDEIFFDEECRKVRFILTLNEDKINLTQKIIYAKRNGGIRKESNFRYFPYTRTKTTQNERDL